MSLFWIDEETNNVFKLLFEDSFKYHFECTKTKKRVWLPKDKNCKLISIYELARTIVL